MFRIKQMAYPTERSTLELFYRKLNIIIVLFII